MKLFFCWALSVYPALKAQTHEKNGVKPSYKKDSTIIEFEYNMGSKRTDPGPERWPERTMPDIVSDRPC